MSKIVVQSLSCIWLFATPGTAVCQASLSFTVSWSLLKLRTIESVMPSNQLILCCPLLLLPSIFPSIRVFSNESALNIRQPKYWSFSFSISPSNEYSGLISYFMSKIHKHKLHIHCFFFLNPLQLSCKPSLRPSIKINTPFHNQCMQSLSQAI